MIDEQSARLQIVEAGHMLLEKKLAARTWGNISARISEDAFLITPSGRAYDTLKPEELSLVSLSDGSFTGSFKPSSETGMHAAVYKLRPGADFIIHTHQHYATVLSVQGEDIPSAPCAEYAFPGTPDLHRKVAATVEAHPGDNTFLMARHGVLAIGTSLSDAFSLAEELEAYAKTVFDAGRHDASPAQERKCYLDDYAQMAGIFGISKKEDPAYAELIVRKNRDAARYVHGAAKPMKFSDVLAQALFYRLKYSRRKDG